MYRKSRLINSLLYALGRTGFSVQPFDVGPGPQSENFSSFPKPKSRVGHDFGMLTTFRGELGIDPPRNDPMSINIYNMYILYM